jgi:hypothetical protein
MDIRTFLYSMLFQRDGPIYIDMYVVDSFHGSALKLADTAERQNVGIRISRRPYLLVSGALVFSANVSPATRSTCARLLKHRTKL